MAHDHVFEDIKLKTTDCKQVLPSSGDGSANQIKYWFCSSGQTGISASKDPIEFKWKPAGSCRRVDRQRCATHRNNAWLIEPPQHHFEPGRISCSIIIQKY